MKKYCVSDSNGAEHTVRADSATVSWEGLHWRVEFYKDSTLCAAFPQFTYFEEVVEG